MATKYHFPNEDHTFGGLITTLLRDNPAVLYTAYTVNDTGVLLTVDAQDPSHALYSALRAGVTLVASLRQELVAAAK